MPATLTDPALSICRVYGHRASPKVEFQPAFMTLPDSIGIQIGAFEITLDLDTAAAMAEQISAAIAGRPTAERVEG